MALNTDFLHTAGDVIIKTLALASNRGVYENLIDYLVEINIHENLFSPFLTGSIVLSDSRNLIRDMVIVGDEVLVAEFRTPGLPEDAVIKKVFRIYSLKDKFYAKDGNTQLYVLHFCSPETFADIDNPIFQAFEGKPEDIVQEIFDTYLSLDKNISLDGNVLPIEKNNINIISKSTNKIKFVSPGWSPIECINWISSKSIPEEGGANFLFWETVYGFFYGTINDLIKENIILGNYALSEAAANALQVDDANKKLATIKSLKVKQSFDQLSNRITGYLSNRLTDVDLYNKNYKNIDYDHTLDFNNYSHLEGNKSIPLFEYSSTKNPATSRALNYSYPTLFDNVENNFDSITKDVYGNRKSNMLELGNFRMELGIHGRTDVFCGGVINVTLPKASPYSLSDKSTDETHDILYSGNYLITNITHKINPKYHHISMLVSKDSLSSAGYS